MCQACMEIQTEVKKPERAYRWAVEYLNGKTAFQGDISFREVLEANKEGEVKQFALIPLDPNSKFKQLVVDLGDKRRRLIYFERTIGNTGNEFEPFLVYLLGWQETIKGVNTKCIMYVYPNGNIEINNDEATLVDDYILKLKES
jgi:hypothetical protein